MRILIIIISLFFSTVAFAQKDTIYIYGPGGPYPAFQKVADAFEKEYDIHVNITKGPLGNWQSSAKENADLIFSGSEHMMTQFEKLFTKEILAASVMPLYKRHSGLIVRKGNPKNIKGIKDLIRKDVKILVVQGAGLSGVWEDMLGSMKKMEDFKNIRSKIVVFADNSGLAQKAWNEDPSIDVWISWNIWQMANQESADFILVPKKYRIYRNTDIALTHKGKDKKAAILFYDFLQSAKTKEIFKQMGWE